MPHVSDFAQTLQQEGDTGLEVVAARDEDLVQPERQGSRLLDLSRELEVQLINFNPDPIRTPFLTMTPTLTLPLGTCWTCPGSSRCSSAT